MKHQLYSKNVTITDSLKEYIGIKLGHLDSYSFDVISCRVDIGRDQRHRKGDVFRIEINMNIPSKLLRIVENHQDARAAIDLATEKLLRRAKKFTEKKRDKSRRFSRFLKHHR